MADRFTVPGRFRPCGMLLVESDAAYAVALLEDEPDFARRLQEKNRLRRVEQKSCHAYRPAARLPRKYDLAGQRFLVLLSQRLDDPWLQDRIAKIGDAEIR